MNTPNLDENTMQNIKNMIDKGNISEAISQISPDMIQNFQTMLNNSQSDNATNQNHNQTSNHSNSANTETNNIFNNFDISKIDLNTMMKINSIFNNMNNKNDPRTNLIYSLKPYLRDSKKGKIDQYANLLNLSKMADLFKNSNSEQPHD